MSDKDPSDMNDRELYWRYQEAKEYAPVERIDELQVEAADRWCYLMDVNRNV